MKNSFWCLTFSFLALTTTPLRAVEADEAMKPGLIGEYFDRLVEVDDFPIISDGEKADLKRVDTKIDWASTNDGACDTQWKDYLYARWTGAIRIPKDGKYSFYLTSDDGSRMFLDGNLVVDNGGLHGMDEKSGDVDLKAGDHSLKIEYFENEQGAGCQFAWKGPDVEKQTVPGNVFFHNLLAEK